MQRNAKGVVIEQLNAPKHAQTAKRWPISKQERRVTLIECLLINQKRKDMHNPPKDGQYTTKRQRNAKRVLIEHSKVQKHAQPPKGWSINGQKPRLTLN